MGDDAESIIDLSCFRYFGNIFNLSSTANIDKCTNLETIMFPEGAKYVGSVPYRNLERTQLMKVSLVIFPSTLTEMRDQTLRYTSVTNPVYIFLGNGCKPSFVTNLGGKCTVYVKDKYFNEFYEYYNHNSRFKPLSQWDGELPLSYLY